jgi:hypothetical protein
MAFTKTTHARASAITAFTTHTHFHHNNSFHKNDTPAARAADTLREGVRLPRNRIDPNNELL